MLTSTVHERRLNLFKISTRDAHLHLSTQDAHLHLSTRDAHLHLSAIDKISLPGKNTRAQEKLGPRHRFHPAKNSGRATRAKVPPRRKFGPQYSGPDSTQEKTRAPILGARFHPGERYSGPNFTRGKIRARILGSRFPGYRSPLSPPELMPVCSNFPLSLSSSGSPCYSLGPLLGPLLARSHLDSQLLSFVERILMGISSDLARKSSLASRWPDATESGVGITLD